MISNQLGLRHVNQVKVTSASLTQHQRSAAFLWLGQTLPEVFLSWLLGAREPSNLFLVLQSRTTPAARTGG